MQTRHLNALQMIVAILLISTVPLYAQRQQQNVAKFDQLACALAADLFATKLGAEVAVSNKELGMDILGGGVVADQSGATFDRQV